MSNTGRLRIKNLSELVGVNANSVYKNDCGKSAKNDIESDGSEVEFVPVTTPVKIRGKRAQTTSKKTNIKEKNPTDSPKSKSEAKAVTPKKTLKTTKKELPPDQTKIDSFFKSCAKTYTIEKSSTESKARIGKENCTKGTTGNKRTARRRIKNASPPKRRKGRKRLFDDTTSETTETTTSMSCFTEQIAPKAGRKRKTPLRSAKTANEKQLKQVIAAHIDLCSESEEELGVIMKAEPSSETDVPSEKHSSQPIESKAESNAESKKGAKVEPPPCMNEEKPKATPATTTEVKEPPMVSIHLHANVRLQIPSPPTSTSEGTSAENGQIRVEPNNVDDSDLPTKIDVDCFESEDVKEWNGPRRRVRKCPPYKVIVGTTFAVDGFQFGPIKGVTHYFLSHFHADHYIGLTRKFSMPLFLSAITANLLRLFIPIDEEFLRIMELNEPQIINGIEVTAIDANHCPGAIMFVFKLPTGKCILHTGDFRASPNMESEPIFWNNDIDIIYLDTTYISNKYAFCTQDESIANAQRLIEEFKAKYEAKKILYICGAYLIGKEKFWSAIARKYKLTVWTDPKREKALQATGEPDIISFLNKDPKLANLHVITMGKLSYFSLVEYFEPYSSVFDLCLAIRPSGWEKNSKPQYRGKINIIGIEYSEHSSYKEMQRFVTYLKPKEVISTVPSSHDLMHTSKVPESWYKYNEFPNHIGNWQPSITSYLKLKTRNAKSNKKNCENITDLCTPPNNTQLQENADSPKDSPNNLSLKVVYDADDDWLS